MSFWGRLLGTDKAIDNIMDKDNGLVVRAGRWVDELHHTEEEKSKAGMEIRKWGLAQLEALGPFKIVQRILAFNITFMWMFVAVNVVAALWYEELVAPRQPEGCPAGTVCEPHSIAQDMMTFAMSDYIFWPVLSLLSLYFLGGVTPSIFGKKSDS